MDQSTLNKKIIIALDFEDTKQTLDFLEPFDSTLTWVKVGMELFYKEGTKILDELAKRELKIFLDLKIHDIPQTVFKTIKNLKSLPIHMINVHLSGGSDMLLSAKEAVQLMPNPPLLIGVSLLTSFNEPHFQSTFQTQLKMDEMILHWAKLASASQLDGIVCSAQDILALKSHLPLRFKFITPGIRTHNQIVNDDQKRMATPKEALKLGSDFLVIGRPITQALNPFETYKRILQELTYGE